MIKPLSKVIQYQLFGEPVVRTYCPGVYMFQQRVRSARVVRNPVKGQLKLSLCKHKIDS